MCVCDRERERERKALRHDTEVHVLCLCHAEDTNKRKAAKAHLQFFNVTLPASPFQCAQPPPTHPFR